METIKLDLIPGKKMPSLHASQYDDGREHGIDLFENGVVYKLDGTETLTINERKGDDCICSLDIENTFADSNHIVFASTEQMCAVWGNNICELVIAKGEKTIGTLNFILEVEPSPTENGIESESEIKNLTRQIEAITEEVIGEDYYTAEETDEAIATATEGKADKTYVDTELAKKADKTDTYTKTEVNTRLNNKMDKSNPTGTGKLSVGSNILNLGQGSHALGSDILTYGQNTLAVGKGTGAASDNQFVFGKYNQQDWSGNYVEVVGNGTNGHPSNARTLDWQGNEMLAGDLIFNRSFSLTQRLSEKAEKNNTYTKSEVDTLIDNLPEPMIFKGTLGVGGTIQSLPTASASNEGFTYKVITDGTYAGQTAKVGDVFTSNGSAWVLIPSGDEDNDTWRAIKVNGVEKLGNGISSGAVDFEDTANVKFEFDANGNKVRAKLDGIYTESEVDNLLDEKADKETTYTKAQVDDIVYNILPDDTASGSVANFDTSLELPIKSLEIDVNAVQSAGTPTPATPLPISGRSEISLVHCGANLFDGHLVNGIIDSSSGAVTPNNNNFASENFISVKENTTIVFVCSAKSSGDRFGRAFYDKNQNYISGSYVVDYQTSITVPSGAYYMKFFVPTSWYGSTASNNISINYPSSDTAYHAYNPNTNTEVINLGGTYYGGHFTQDKDGHRQFEVTHNYIASYNGEAINEPWISSMDAYSQGATPTTGAQVVYPLGTPYTIDLPDGEPIITLNGTNNIYADTGDCAVEYKCSVAEYVANHSGGGGAKSLGGVYLGGSNSGSEEETTEEEPKEVTKTLGDEPISKK